MSIFGNRREEGQGGIQWDSLRLQLTLGVSLLVGGCIGLLTFIAVAQLQTEFVEQVEREQASNVRVVTKWVDGEVRERIAALQALGSTLDRTYLDDRARLQRYLADKPVAQVLFRRA